MRLKTWPVAALGLGALLLLIVVSLLASARRAENIYSQLDQINSYHHNVDGKLRRLRSDIHLSGIFLRDYLLEVASEQSPGHREQLAEFRRTSKATISELRALSREYDDRVRSLEAKLDAYWQAFDPVFDWTPAEKIARSSTFLQREVVPRRLAVMAIAYEIEGLNEANLAAERGKVAAQHASFHTDLNRLLWQSVLLGLAVALVAVFRLRWLEKRSEKQRAIAEEAERQMRQLSQRLVAAQEEERKRLSRELHDHIAQVLTALRMEIGRIDRSRGSGDSRLGAAVEECRRLVDNMFRSVRDLALGLRPSMLDDFGLQPALEWQVRDFRGRFDMNVELSVNGDLDVLPDRYRTCVYRVVQEALTNCARHANARSVKVSVAGDVDQVDVSVKDDGIGLDPARRRDGLGLRGMEERVKELHGALTISGAAGVGTTLAIHLPLPASIREVPLAPAAG